jgi:hypothetical protein
MEIYLGLGLVAAIGYIVLLRNNVGTLRKLVNFKDTENTSLKMQLEDYKGKLATTERSLAAYLQGVKKDSKPLVDNTKKGEELVNETNDLITQPGLFDLDDDDDDARFVLSNT